MQTSRHLIALTTLIGTLLATTAFAAPPSPQKSRDKDPDAALVKIASDRRRLEMKFTALQNEYQYLSSRLSKARIDLALMELDGQLAETSKGQRSIKSRYLISKKRMEVLNRLLRTKEREVDACLKSISSLTIKEKKETEKQTGSAKIAASRTYTISLAKTGDATIRGITVRPDTLHDKLAGLGAQKSDTIAIKAHREANYEAVLRVLRSLRDVGYLRVLIITNK